CIFEGSDMAWHPPWHPGSHRVYAHAGELFRFLSSLLEGCAVAFAGNLDARRVRRHRFRDRAPQNRATRAAARSRRSLSADHPGPILRLDVRVWREAWQNATRGVTTAGVLRLEQRVSTSELRRSRISRAQRPAASGRAGRVRLAGEQDRTN